MMHDISIVDASLHRVTLPLVREFATSSHQKASLTHILVRLEDALGNVGWGEIASPSAPFYAPETVETCWLIASRYLLPGIVGKTFAEPADAAATWAKIRGHFFAKAGVDAALWDLWTRRNGVSLAQALGGTRNEIVAGVSLGIEPTIGDLLVQVEKHLNAGYPRIKLKIAPGWDVDPVRAVREAFGDIDLHVDANGVYQDSPEHWEIMQDLDEFGLTMIEQPYHPRDFVGHARLQASLETPICLDESVETVEDLRTMIELDAGRVLNIKVSRMGGLTPARIAHDLAASEGIPVWCGGMHEFGIGRAANIAIASLPGFTLTSDVSGSDKYYARDITTRPIVAVQGRVAVPQAPGSGYDLDAEMLAEHSEETFSLR